MKISLNTTPNFNYTKEYDKQNKSDNAKYNPAFTGSVSQVYDSFCHGVGKKVCGKLFDNKLINWIGGLPKDPDNAVKHFLVVGSVITSGMYMKQTLTNDKMDKDRRQTLAVNQGFTLILSTLGAYTLDSKLRKWWGDKHLEYIALSDEGKAIIDGFKKKNAEIAEKNKNLAKELQQEKLKIDQYIDKFGSEHVVDKKALQSLKIRSKGFNALRQILVFGFVYRFFVPLVVVKPTNWLCERYLENKKKKQELAAQQNNPQKS